MKTVKTKITVAVSLMIALLCTINVVIGIAISRKGLLDNVEKDLSSTLEIAQVAVFIMVQAEKDKAIIIAAGMRSTSDYSAVLASVDHYVDTYGWDGIGIVDVSGVVHSSYDGISGLNISQEAYYNTAMISRKAVMTTTVYDKNGELKFYLFAPMNNGNLFMISMDCMRLSNLLGEIRIGETGSVFVLDGNGIMIANIRPEMVLERSDYIARGEVEQEYAKVGQVYSRMRAQEKGLDSYTINGVERLVAFMPVSDTDNWSVGAAVPKQEMLTTVWLVVVTMVTASLVLLVIAVLFTRAFAKSIGDPIRLCAQRLEKLSEGDLSSPVEQISSKDETGLLADATANIVTRLKDIISDIGYLTGEMAEGNFNVNTRCEDRYVGEYHQILGSIRKNNRNLNKTLSQISLAAREVNSGAEQVSDSAQSLSQGATEQAASIEELSATMADVAHRIAVSAQKSNEATQLSTDAEQDVLLSNQKMEQMSASMDEITHKSNEIGKIIKTIDDIAFQTNILALNAAVEAARAGEAGRGFAVVASEVRDLAQKSAEAAKSTTALIEGTVKAVSGGARLTEETAVALASASAKVAGVNMLISEISDASQEQAGAVTQISDGIQQIAAVVHTNSATAEESAAASQELSGQSEMLRELLGQFLFRDENHTAENTEETAWM